MVYWPAKLAELGFVDGVRRLVQVPRIALDEETQDRLFTAVLRESARNLQLAGGPGGAYFERVELTADADPLHLSMRALAELGPGLRGAAACGASVSLDFPGVDVWFDVTRTCMTSLAAPGDRFEPYVRTKFPELVAEAGWTGNLVALPFQLAAPGRATLQEAPAIRPEAMLKMERLGLLLPSVAGSEVFWGLMKTGATREQALCALDGKPGCKQRLQPGGTVQVGDAFARLVQVGSLWVVMTSNDKAALLGVSPRATDGPVAPLRAQGSRAAVAHELRSAGLSLAPSGYVAEGRLEQGRLAVSLSPQ
jgi:hypothetical protein